MMSNGTNERLKKSTQHVPFRENTEEKVRGKELETVWDDVNEWNYDERPRWKVQGDWNPYNRCFRHNQTNTTLWTLIKCRSGKWHIQKKKMGPQEVIKNTVPKNKRKKGQQYTHKPNFDYQVETEDNEHEPHQESG